MSSIQEDSQDNLAPYYTREAGNRFQKILIFSGIVFATSMIALLIIYLYVNPFTSGFSLLNHLVLFAGPVTTSSISFVTFIISGFFHRNAEKVFQIPSLTINTRVKEKLPIEELSSSSETEEAFEVIKQSDIQGIDFKEEDVAQVEEKDSNLDGLKHSVDQSEPSNPMMQTSDIDTTQVLGSSLFEEPEVENLDSAFTKVIDPVLSSLGRFLVSLAKSNYYSEKGNVDTQDINTKCAAITTLLTNLRKLFHSALSGSYFIPKRLTAIILSEESITRARRRLVIAHNEGAKTSELAKQIETLQRLNDLSDIKQALLSYHIKVEKDPSIFLGELLNLVAGHLVREFSLDVEEDIVYQSNLKLLEILKSADIAEISTNLEALAAKASMGEDLRKPIQEFLQCVFEGIYQKDSEAFGEISKTMLDRTLISSMNSATQSHGVQVLFQFFMELIGRNLGILSLYFQKDCEYAMYENFISSESFDLIKKENKDFHKALFRTQFNINKKFKLSDNSKSMDPRIALICLNDLVVKGKLETILKDTKKKIDHTNTKKELCTDLFSHDAIRCCFGLRSDASEQEQLIALEVLISYQSRFRSEVLGLENNNLIIAVPCSVNTHPLFKIKEKSESTFFPASLLRKGLSLRDSLLTMLSYISFIKELLETKLYNFPGFNPTEAEEYRKILDNLLTSQAIYPIYDILFMKDRPFAKTFEKVLKANITDIENQFLELSKDPNLDLSKLKEALAGKEKEEAEDSEGLAIQEVGLFNYLAKIFEATYADKE